MTKKYWEMTRKQDIKDAKECLQKARYYRNKSKYNHNDLMRVARLYIDNIRNCNKKLETYK